MFDLDLTIFDRDGIMSDLYPKEWKDFIEWAGKISPTLVELVDAQAHYHLIEKKVTSIIQELNEINKYLNKI